MGIQTDFVIIITNTETLSCAGSRDGHFRTVGLCLKFHPSAFVVHSEGREDKQVHMYKERSPQDCESGDLQTSFRNSLETLGFWIQGRFGLCHSSSQNKRNILIVCLPENLRKESWRCLQSAASWLCISRCLDTLGTFTRAQSWRTPTRSKTCPAPRLLKIPIVSVRVLEHHLLVAWDTNYPQTPCR